MLSMKLDLKLGLDGTDNSMVGYDREGDIDSVGVGGFEIG
jgi:hypothetical protein